MGRREQYRIDFEATFTKTVSRDPPFFTPPVTLAEGLWPIARYFARFRTTVDGADCYSRLVLALANSGHLEEAVFATLNYGCLLEQSILAHGEQIEHISREFEAALPSLLSRLHLA